MIMTEDGTIMTNAHVVSGAQSITVRVMDGTEYEATLLGMDEKTDLAVIKIDATGLTPAEFGDSSSIVQGEIAVAIGNPLGLAFEGSVTQGIISAVSREIEVDGRTMTYIQTDAAINPGNSGGALVNGSGQVIGINSVKVSSSDVEGLGFAIPISVALPIAEQLTTYGYVTGRPSIGIGGEDVTDYMVYYYRIPRGVLVGLVTPDSGAEAGGVEVGDVIVGLNGVSVSSMDELTNEKDKFSPGDTVTLTVYRSLASMWSSTWCWENRREVDGLEDSICSCRLFRGLEGEQLREALAFFGARELAYRKGEQLHPHRRRHAQLWPGAGGRRVGVQHRHQRQPHDYGQRWQGGDLRGNRSPSCRSAKAPSMRRQIPTAGFCGCPPAACTPCRSSRSLRAAPLPGASSPCWPSAPSP